jgi:hypothetical protein
MSSAQVQYLPVVPVKAGTQLCVSQDLSIWIWISAFAGMSGEGGA